MGELLKAATITLQPLLNFIYSLVGSFLLAPKPSDADAVAGLYGLMLVLAIGAILLGVFINKNAERNAFGLFQPVN